ncbi:hypothetical protein VNI00_004741 [Paramarasmius palmivorus]|uniref:LIM-domain binding protein-domain-containing protein n=1 Tax=Paramarasmius palmivorus TaxID=297713 RepID=A0AAW0DIV2_9AGAR
MLRQGSVNQPQMMSLTNGPFAVTNSQQSNMPPNSNPGAPPMTMLNGPPNPGNRFSLQPGGPMHPGQQPRPLQNALRPGQNPQSLNPGSVPSSHMNNNMPMNLAFSPNMMAGGPPGASNPLRRVSSQPQMNANAMMGMNMNPGMGMGIGQQNGLPGTMRQPPMAGQQPQNHLRAPMQPDMQLNRPGPSGSPAMNSMNRANTTQPVMNSLNPPPPSNLGLGGMPGNLPGHRNEFPNAMHHPPLAGSPRPGTHPQNPGMSMGGPGPSQQSIHRRTPDNLLFNPSGNSFPPQGPGNGPVNGYTGFPPSTPPNNMGEMSSSLPGSIGNTPGNTPNHPNFTVTPAQKLEQMHPNEAFPGSFGMSPQNQNGGQPHPPTPHNVNHPHHPTHRPPSQQQHHSSPHPNDIAMNIYPPRPPSQPPNPNARPPSSHTSRPPSLSQPPPNSGMLPPGRISQSGGPLGQPPSHQTPPQSIRPTSSGGPPGPGPSQPMVPPGSMPHGNPSQHPQSAIAPRPPGHPQPPQLPQPQPPSQQLHPPGGQPAEPPHDEASPSSGGSGAGPHSASSANVSLQAPIGFAMPPRPTGATYNPAQVLPTGISMPHALGHGQGLLRLLQFSGVLANESKQKVQLSWWNDLVREYFTPKSVVKFTLWKDSQRTEAKVFEIGVPVLPRFFLVTTQSGVKSMTLTLDGARERLFDYGHAIVECVSAIWTYKFNNGYTVALKGPLTVHVVVTAAAPPGTQAPSVHHPHHQTGGNFYLKFENFEFEAKSHEKFIALDAITMGQRTIESPKMSRGGRQSDVSDQQEEERKWEEPRIIIERGHIPGEPVNAFGIPQATMRCLELADSCADMADLIVFSTEHELGPKDALRQMSSELRERMGYSAPMMNGIAHPGGLPNPSGTPTTSSFPNFQSGIPAQTLYASAPGSITNTALVQTPSTMASAMSSPQNAPTSAQNSPRKQHMSIPSSAGQTAGPSAIGGVLGGAPPSSASASSTGNLTPSMSAANLKRKQVTDSPNSSAEGPPQKRPQRKRKTGP